LIGGTLVANLIGLAIVVGGVLVAWGRAHSRELGLRAADVPHALVTTLAIWAALNLGAIVADLWAGEHIELAAGWRAPRGRPPCALEHAGAAGVRAALGHRRRCHGGIRSTETTPEANGAERSTLAR
jgi:hypothetical protein